MLPYEACVQERNWRHSSYPAETQHAIDRLQAPIFPPGTYPPGVDIRGMPYFLFGHLVERLRHPELLPMLLRVCDGAVSDLLLARHAVDNDLNEKLIEVLKAEKRADALFDYDGRGDVSERIDDLFQYARDTIEPGELAWLDHPETRAQLQELQALRESMDSDPIDKLNADQAQGQVELLLARWGEPLLALSLDAWARFQRLVSSHVPAYHAKLQQLTEFRNKYPWIAECQQVYERQKKEAA